MLHAVRRHNRSCPEQPIKSVLCPGLGTAVGRMPVLRCAIQMRVAYEAVMFGDVEAINRPPGLGDACSHHFFLTRVSVPWCAASISPPHFNACVYTSVLVSALMPALGH